MEGEGSSRYFVPQTDEVLDDRRLREIFEQIQIRLDTGDSQSEKVASREIRGTIVGTYIGGQSWCSTPIVPHGLGTIPRVICSLADANTLANVDAGAEPYLVTATGFRAIINSPGAVPAIGLQVAVNYIAWVG